jgi:drug/metabolite transporter (DMT)-like permease
MKIVLGLLAALLVGAGLVLQQAAAQQAPTSYFLRLRLITDLLRRRRWLAGLAIMTSGEILSAWTIGNLELSLAEPLLSTSLIFALLIAVPLTGQRPRKSELIGAVLLACGVAALSLSREVSAPSASFGSVGYWPSAAGIALVAFALVRAGWRRSGSRRALLTGTAAGMTFGISDALTRGTLLILASHGLVAALTSWPAYSLAGASVLALWLMQSAFNAAPLHASLPAITAAEPVVGILLGIIVFGDDLRISPGAITLEAAGFVALIGGVILVARAPMISGVAAARAIREVLPGLEPTNEESAAGEGQDDKKPEREEV